MEFGDYWKEAWLEMDFPETAHDVERIVRAAYRAGLLHAAEQDDGIAKQNKDLPMTCPRAYEYSAICHREAASDLK